MTLRTPAERARLLRASGTFQAVADALRALAKGDDRVAREARELQDRARTAAEGLRDAVLLEEVGGGG